MEWNDGRERALFEREQAQKRKEYLAVGMTEAQIQPYGAMTKNGTEVAGVKRFMRSD